MKTSAAVITVLVVDDHPLMRDGIAALLAREPDLRLVGEASNGEQAVEMHRALRPDVTLMDIQMPSIGGIETIAAIRAEAPSARIIVLTTYGSDTLAKRALKSGAQAYLLKSAVRLELPDAIRAVNRGQVRVSAEVAGLMASRIGAEDLSAREIEVLKAVAAGNSNKSIAAKMGLSEETIKGHMKNILSKLEARDRTHAVAIAIARGMISAEHPT